MHTCRYQVHELVCNTLEDGRQSNIWQPLAMIVDMVLLVTSHLGASWTNYVVLTAESIYEQPFAQLTP